MSISKEKIMLGCHLGLFILPFILFAALNTAHAAEVISGGSVNPTGETRGTTAGNVGAATPRPPGGGTETAGQTGGTAAGSNYLKTLYTWFLAFVGISALFQIVRGGIYYMFSGTSLTKAEEGRRWITNAIYGIVLAAASVLLLQTINPDLINHGFDLTKIIEKK